jgi:hypothetical protein
MSNAKHGSRGNDQVTADWSHWNDPQNLTNAMRYYSHLLNLWMWPWVRWTQMVWDMNPWLPGAANPFMRAHRHPAHPGHEAWRPCPPEPVATWHVDDPAGEIDTWGSFQQPEEWPDPFETK